MDFLVSNFDNIKYDFDLYFSDSKYFLIFLIAIVFNFFIVKKSNKNEKILLVLLPIIIMILVFNPIVFKLLDPFLGDGEGNTYWRMFWLMPIAPTIAYAFTSFASSSKNKFIMTFLSVMCIIVIVLSGKLAYSEENYQIANNWYKMPEEVLEVMQIIQSQDIDNKVIYAPSNMVEWVRQYDGNIKLVYGRNPSIIVFMGREIDAGRIYWNMETLFRYHKCNFIVLLRNVTYDANLEDFNFKKIGSTSNYLIYMLDEKK